MQLNSKIEKSKRGPDFNQGKSNKKTIKYYSCRPGK
jgi:hypothetical protein